MREKHGTVRIMFLDINYYGDPEYEWTMLILDHPEADECSPKFPIVIEEVKEQ